MYTMEQFKEMFEKARKETIEQMQKEFKEATEQGEQPVNPVAELMYQMQNMLAFAELKRNLFEPKE